MYPVWLNVLGFQSGWWACVLGAGQTMEIPSIALGWVLVCAHVWLSAHRRAEIQLALLAIAMGLLADSALQSLGLISFYGWALGPLSPFWLWTLWALFALTLNASLAFLKRMHWGVSAAAGLVFGPITYHAGAAFGAAAEPAGGFATFGLAVTWMVLLPLLVLAAQHFSSPTHEFISDAR